MTKEERTNPDVLNGSRRKRIAKGSGMIHPNMATMLAFVFTDANISAPALKAMLKITVFR